MPVAIQKRIRCTVNTVTNLNENYNYEFFLCFICMRVFVLVVLLHVIEMANLLKDLLAPYTNNDSRKAVILCPLDMLFNCFVLFAISVFTNPALLFQDVLFLSSFRIHFYVYHFSKTSS